VSRFTASKCKTNLGLEPEELYTCGLLHDVGKVVMLDSMMEKYIEAVRTSKEKNQAIEISEEEILGFSHMEVGAIIAMRWGLPTSVVNSIQYHHGPLESVLKDVCVAIVNVSDRICEHVEGEQEINTREVFYPGIRRILGLDEADFNEIVDFARQSWPEIQI
jgi:putative nucleotidyltransferase with HDIG domain